jgi:hypothetical protein
MDVINRLKPLGIKYFVNSSEEQTRRTEAQGQPARLSARSSHDCDQELFA